MTEKYSRPAWQPGMPVLTEKDHAEWQVWRRERILELQRDRCSRLRRIDYYPSQAAAAVVDSMRARCARGEASVMCRKEQHSEK
jgi:hypothetical protein